MPTRGPHRESDLSCRAMKLIRFKDRDTKKRIITCVDCGDGTALPLAGSVFDRIEPLDEPVPFDESDLVAPVRPTVIMGIGMNYAAHATEQGKEPPQRPMMFMKNINATSGPFDDIVIPKVCQDREQVDFECELAVVIGKPARDVPLESALDYVLGYTAANDVSARWWQKSGGGGQFCRGKSFDTFCPLGPCLVTPDDIPDPQALSISTKINGETMQSSTTGDMIFPVAELIHFLSQGTTLPPGTVILTGTPQGVGFARDPQVWLKDGDIVEVTVEKIGALRNRVRTETG